ncbi:MAG: hypothetical protein A2Y78_02320 [Acidobacteria bacterium RBG_13_68_16]|nr:MAG: hypothetical protein A2Y78_02320 [Acidobacteria bacterium RBG_13_68_16]
MFRVRYALQVLLAAASLVVAMALVKGRGVPGEVQAGALARAALVHLGYEPLGEPTATFEGDQELAWALERARPGPAGVRLARGQGGAVRWRLVFPGGGEAQVTVDGVIWSLRRPVPSAPGPALFPSMARSRVETAVAEAIPDPSAWGLVRAQSWREGGHIWQRGWYVGGAGELPSGWRRELELEMVGSTVVSWRRTVHPLGTDLGVVTGRMAELQLLRRPALLGLGILVIGVFVAAAESVAYRESTAIARGVAYGLVTATAGSFASDTLVAAPIQGVVAAVVVALLPVWTELPRTRLRFGPAAGVALAAVTLAGRAYILGAGGWTPVTPPVPGDIGPIRLLADSWAPALVEEPLLRGALPALAVPVVGWWGAALLAAPVGVLLHPLPTVPLAASFALELVLQLGLAAVARFAGVGGAVLARGTCEALVRRASFPVGSDWDRVALIGVILGAVLLLWPRRRE